MSETRRHKFFITSLGSFLSHSGELLLSSSSSSSLRQVEHRKDSKKFFFVSERASEREREFINIHKLNSKCSTKAQYVCVSSLFLYFWERFIGVLCSCSLPPALCVFKSLSRVLFFFSFLEKKKKKKFSFSEWIFTCMYTGWDALECAAVVVFLLLVRFFKC